MAKKGGVQQLQAEITTDEEFDAFLERPGLLVMDIYSEWCGPCTGMVGTLKRIKLEIGGDDLQLAVCKADTISYLQRFQRKSEPTWLFATRGKAVNLMFGTNVPKLTKLIEHELKLLSNKSRATYEITELQPEEVKRKRVKDDAERAEKEAILNQKLKKRRDYLNYVTDTIIDNMPDIGVTLFGPQVNRDMIKRILEPADALKIQCKDRKVTQVLKEHFEVINYACTNPIDPEVLDQLDQRELLVCFWKMPDDNRRPVHEILAIYEHELTRQRVQHDDITGEDITLPPILTTMDVTYDIILNEGDEGWEEAAPPPQPDRKSRKSRMSSIIFGVDSEAPVETEGEDDEEEGDEGELDEGEGLGGDMGMDLGFEDTMMDLIDIVEEPVAEESKTRTKVVTVTLPPIWVPNNARTHAAMIYTYFHKQTAPFLPPDPVPEPPHVIMAFDAYKKKDLIGLAERNKEDIPLYGFFTSDDADDTVFIANSDSKYRHSKQTAGDKLVFKVNKQTSNTMLSLATYGPSYVSPSPEVGHEEALKFFPKSYKTASQEEEEMRILEQETKRKSKKSSRINEIKKPIEEPPAPTEAPQESEPQPPPEAPAEGGSPPGEGGSPPGEGEAAAPEGEAAEGVVKGDAEGAEPGAEPAAEGEPGEEGAPVAEGELAPEATAADAPAEEAAEAPTEVADAPPAEVEPAPEPEPQPAPE